MEVKAKAVPLSGCQCSYSHTDDVAKASDPVTHRTLESAGFHESPPHSWRLQLSHGPSAAARPAKSVRETG